MKNFLFQVVRYLQFNNEHVVQSVLAHSFILNDSDHAQDSVPSLGMSTISLRAAGMRCVSCYCQVGFPVVTAKEQLREHGSVKFDMHKICEMDALLW